MKKSLLQQIGIIPLLFCGGLTMAFATDIHSVTTGRNTNGGYEIQIGGNDLIGVKSYSLDNPARIVVDIPNAKSHLTEQITEVTHPVVSSVAVIEGEDRVRATINLAKMLPYNIIEKNNRITVVLGSNRAYSPKVAKQSTEQSDRFADIDFQRGNDGQGKVRINLPNGNSAVDVVRQGRKVVARLQGSGFNKTRRLNVGDFGTPVKSIDVYKNNINILTFDDNYKIVSYQNDDVFSIEFNKPTQEELNQKELLPGDSRKKYTGEPLSLNFQDIEVRSVLQLIGDFTNTNIVVSDAVQGSITLRLNNVPWDQALDIILQTKGLSRQENGDIIYVAPSKDIAASKRAAYDVANVEKELAPLQQQLIQVQYARAEELEKIIEDNSKSEGKTGDETSVDGLLSGRGRVSVDPRTNTIIINDVVSSIDKVRQLIGKLDVPVDQVLIDARIVTATNNFAHDLGVRFGVAGRGGFNKQSRTGKRAGFIFSGDLEDTTNIYEENKTELGNRLGVNLPAAGKTANSFGLSLLGKDFLIDLELSAMQDEGRGEIISSPRVIAQDGGKAEIRQGTQIAYSTIDKDGRVKTEWKDVPLKLTVKPKIAPNNQVDMDLLIIKDTPGAIYNGEQGIDSSSVTTQVLVDNGETVVLGGVFEQIKRKAVSKVPLLGDLPVVGRAFRRDTNSVKKSELLIFVTPKIIDKRYTSRDKFIQLRK